MMEIFYNFLTKDEQKAIISIIIVLLIGKILFAEFTKERNVPDVRKERTASIRDRAKRIKRLDKVSINYGTLEELQMIPGIGIKTAKNIVNYRNRKGNFKKLEGLKQIKGIGDKKFKKLRSYIKL